MAHRVSPTDRIRGHIDELFAHDRPLPEILEEVARLGAQLLMQATLDAEVNEFLGRHCYQRNASCGDARSGSRNGYGEVSRGSGIRLCLPDRGDDPSRVPSYEEGHESGAAPPDPATGWPRYYPVVVIGW